MKNFALSSTSSTYTPPSLEGRGISFILREPNEDEMEKLSTELFRRGCVPVEQGRMRAVLIDELYHLFDEAAADEKAGLLAQVRPEERRVGKECVRKGRSWWSPYH